MDSITAKIRPAGRHVLTIGRELIQDLHAALIELVKNSYDANASKVTLEFSQDECNNIQTLKVSDNGHGMTTDVVLNQWLVPSTDDKLKRKLSPYGKRVMQGRKGIGRYAASILGEDLLLETTDTNGNTTTIYLVWADFENSEYLDQVEILVELSKNSLPSGTTLTINSKFSESEWNKKQFNELMFQLKKLIPPQELPNKHSSDDNFEIELITFNFLGQNINEIIEPFPLLELSDYRIKGSITDSGKCELLYTFQKYKGQEETVPINFSLDKQTSCGNLYFDIRVFDRGSDDIDNLIRKGLKDDQGNYVGKNQAKSLLNANNGIGVYRNGFRIRPLGDPGFDWLELDKRRVQNPSLRIGSDQVIGFVLIESEESSDLIEKTARDGLKNNLAYENLIKITQTVIAKLEEKRSIFRNALSNKKRESIEKVVQEVFSFENLKSEITQHLISTQAPPEVTAKIISYIDKDAEKRQEKLAFIQQQIAIFQAQATLGKLVQYVIHEGRHYISYIRNSIIFLNDDIDKFLTSASTELNLKIKDASGKIDKNVLNLSNLLKRLDPLATGKRGRPIEINLEQELRNAYENAYSFTSLEESYSKNDIILNITGFNNKIIQGYKQDVISLFVNLFSNSLYWMIKNNSEPKRIVVDCIIENELIQFIDYKDSGPGINPELIASEAIFEPGFTTKIDGIGIGLTIAGETANRLGFDLLVLESTDGAYFRLLNKQNKGLKNDD